jgi:hypothetical protein
LRIEQKAADPSQARLHKYISIRAAILSIPATILAVLSIWKFLWPDPGCSLFRPNRAQIIHSVPPGLQRSQHLGDVWTNATSSDAALKVLSITWDGPNKRAYEVRIAGDVVHESKDGGPFVPRGKVLIMHTRTLSITRDRNYLPDERKGLATEVRIEVCKR